ncbi:LPS export ABC transporter periplasmic protein LptC [Magnetospirillum sulfuroxidans]|uniref:LPS export ABC transporter periplasmic protein LptC n=1 Tax=Magnetospirillum sulfuroxidans TaxID=611300 RepID=A0ABS5ICB3_9PROT|nr:LPS export ABC transporter periplasmic protein LptC [Magnetospirillum sulfuroxidans]MBR9972030.1 LPS export ABC transporter periplasmic protein LptC [Magnetospirillum sulfuroxidans]
MVDLRADSDLRPKPERGRSHPHPVKPVAHRMHSRRVGLLRVALPATALVLLVLLGLWPQLRGNDERFQLGFAKLTPNAVENLSMINARYQGVDKRNNPFAVTADRGVEEDPQNGVVVLDNPKADFVTQGGAGVYIEAKLGTYYQQEQWLDLEGDVNLYHDQGYELHTQRARINLKDSTAEGHDPVTGNGPQGRLNGKGFRILDEGRQIIVTGQAGMSLKGAGRKK